MQSKYLNISYMNTSNLPPVVADSLVSELHEEGSRKFHPRNKIHKVKNLFNKNIFERVVSSFGTAKLLSTMA